ncbi:hypothetical protein F2Q70_00035499 [Brassica cretica]|uniref:NAB domain-containing protein n=1 Tax=Brassica cretica TaxID=69181 RepID=A0A8S9JSJ2_BRACR|nr:hypothetical protein F2Q70_00035499 [Brassica cretica]
MIKLIETDADSFARRAEMYYKKRPELMKLVEELYRAYRALAERYDHTTVQLRHAHKAMAEAFPDQVPFDMIDDSASSTSGPPKEDGATSKSSSSHLNELYQTSDTHQGDSEVESLKRTLLELQTEKEALSLRYQLSLNKLSRFEKELSNAQNDVRGFDERACKAEIEIKVLKESLAKLEVERDTGLLQCTQSMERIADLEASVSHEQEQASSLKQEISRLQSEKEAGLVQYNKCLELISVLEKRIRDAEESVEMFKDKSEQAENETKALKQEVVKLNEVNEDLKVRYQKCLETISNLEREVSHAQDNAKRLSSEVLAGAAKVKTVEEQCARLESFNQNLKVEADNLAQKMSAKDQELVWKQKELEKLQDLMQEQQFRFSELETSLRSLESLHSQSQEEQKVTLQSALLRGALINYSGKLGLFISEDNGYFRSSVSERSTSVQLWVLEDVEKQEWSDHIYLLPALWKNLVGRDYLFFAGVTRTNEIVLAPSCPSYPSFYLCYLNTKRDTVVVRFVEIQGIDVSDYYMDHVVLDHVEDVKLYDV